MAPAKQAAARPGLGLAEIFAQRLLRELGFSVPGPSRLLPEGHLVREEIHPLPSNGHVARQVDVSQRRDPSPACQHALRAQDGRRLIGASGFGRGGGFNMASGLGFKTF